jgi:hypothetical protein
MTALDKTAQVSAQRAGFVRLAQPHADANVDAEIQQQAGLPFPPTRPGNRASTRPQRLALPVSDGSPKGRDAQRLDAGKAGTT